MVSLLAHIKTQNDIIMSILQDKGNIKPKELNPEFKFPLETFEDLDRVEQLLDEKEHRDNLVSFKFDDVIALMAWASHRGVGNIVKFFSFLNLLTSYLKLFTGGLF